MHDWNDPAVATGNVATRDTSDTQARAGEFGEVLRILMQRQQFYIPLTQTYLVAQLSDRVRALDGKGLHPDLLRTYLRGDSLPSDGTLRLLADALGVPRGVLLYAAGYLSFEDLPHYPGPYTTLETIEADISEVETMPLAEPTKERITADLRTRVRILRLLDSERTPFDWRTAADDRQAVLDLLIEVWEAPIPPLPAESVHDRQVRTAHEGTAIVREDTHAPTAAPAAETDHIALRATELARRGD